MTFWQNIKLFLLTATRLRRAAVFSHVKSITVLVQKWQKHIWHLCIQKNIKKTLHVLVSRDILKKIHEYSMDNCSCIVRKINPIICLLLEVQGLLYQRLISQLSKWNIPSRFMSQAIVHHSLILYTGWRIKKTEDGWPPNEAGEGNQRTTSTLATIMQLRPILPLT